MPRPRQEIPRLSPGQAQYVLERLVSDRRISATDVNRYVGDLHREISDLEQRLQSLRSAAGAVLPIKRGPGRPPGSGAKQQQTSGARRGRRPGSAALTPEQRASRQLQGRYLGLIRQIPATRRAQYAKIAKDRGREAAIREMQSALNK